MFLSWTASQFLVNFRVICVIFDFFLLIFRLDNITVVTKFRLNFFHFNLLNQCSVNLLRITDVKILSRVQNYLIFINALQFTALQIFTNLDLKNIYTHTARQLKYYFIENKRNFISLPNLKLILPEVYLSCEHLIWFWRINKNWTPPFFPWPKRQGVLKIRLVLVVIKI